MESYPFLDYINEDKSHYKHAKDCGYVDDDDLFLIGDSGGFLLNINPKDRFVNTHLLYEVADYIEQMVNLQIIKLIVFRIDNLEEENNIDEFMDIQLLVY